MSREPQPSMECQVAEASTRLLQIGDVANLLGLSLRTVRHYEEAGLVVPAARTAGGFRLYDEECVDRLRLIMQMKPLGFTLEEMRLLIEARTELARHDITAERQHVMRERLAMFAAAAAERLAQLRERLAIAESFSATLESEAATSAGRVRRPRRGKDGPTRTGGGRS